jgi:hypothetical protein
MKAWFFRDKVLHGDSTDNLGAYVVFFVLLKQIARGTKPNKTVQKQWLVTKAFFSNDGKFVT